jgi:hypothetical protein
LAYNNNLVEYQGELVDRNWLELQMQTEQNMKESEARARREEEQRQRQEQIMKQQQLERAQREKLEAAARERRQQQLLKNQRQMQETHDNVISLQKDVGQIKQVVEQLEEILVAFITMNMDKEEKQKKKD